MVLHFLIFLPPGIGDIGTKLYVSRLLENIGFRLVHVERLDREKAKLITHVWLMTVLCDVQIFVIIGDNLLTLVGTIAICHKAIFISLKGNRVAQPCRAGRIWIGAIILGLSRLRLW